MGIKRNQNCICYLEQYRTSVIASEEASLICFVLKVRDAHIIIGEQELNGENSYM